MQTSRCPICNSDVIIEDELSANDLVSCANCQTELEIITRHPLQLAGLDGEAGSLDEMAEDYNQSDSDQDQE